MVVDWFGQCAFIFSEWEKSILSRLVGLLSLCVRRSIGGGEGCLDGGYDRCVYLCLFGSENR